MSTTLNDVTDLLIETSSELRDTNKKLNREVVRVRNIAARQNKYGREQREHDKEKNDSIKQAVEDSGAEGNLYLEEISQNSKRLIALTQDHIQTNELVFDLIAEKFDQLIKPRTGPLAAGAFAFLKLGLSIKKPIESIDEHVTKIHEFLTRKDISEIEKKDEKREIVKSASGNEKGSLLSALLGGFGLGKIASLIGGSLLFKGGLVAFLLLPIRNALAEYLESGSIISAVESFGSSLWNMITGGLRFGVTKILDAVGLDGTADFMRDLKILSPKQLGEMVGQFIWDAYEWIEGLLNNAWKEIKNASKIFDKDIIKTFLRAVLPDPESPNAVARTVKHFIPDSVYEYAGLNPRGRADEITRAEDNSEINARTNLARFNTFEDTYGDDAADELAKRLSEFGLKLNTASNRQMTEAIQTVQNKLIERKIITEVNPNFTLSENRIASRGLIEPVEPSPRLNEEAIAENSVRQFDMQNPIGNTNIAQDSSTNISNNNSNSYNINEGRHFDPTDTLLQLRTLPSF